MRGPSTRWESTRSESTRFWIETLGCPKNSVDSDKVRASLLADGLEAADAAEVADLVVVNTCAFVEAARQESIDTILALADARKRGARLVVTGCLAERAGDELTAGLPEVDAVIGFAGEGAISQVAVGAPRRKPVGVRDLLELPRAAPSAPWAYLKIAEGCDRACAFCAIPSFRGTQRSRTPDALLAEARALVDGGVVELVLVAQDLAWYGRDVGEAGALAPLLRRLDAELAPRGLRRIRLLYLYPSEVRDPLVHTMLEVPSVVPYFDLSLQHADRALLASMKRWGSGDRFLSMIDGIRAREPDAAFRSSFIVGFPGESEAQHDSLLGFLCEARLDWAGFFAFSSEAGTPAATMDGVVPEHVVGEWLRECDDVQGTITAGARDALVRAGTEVVVLVDGVDAETSDPIGRTHREAPEIDGIVRLCRPMPKETEPAESTRDVGIVRLCRPMPKETELAESTRDVGIVRLCRPMPKETEPAESTRDVGIVRLCRPMPRETELAESTRDVGIVRLEGAVARPGVFVRAKVVDANGPDLVATPIEVLA